MVEMLFHFMPILGLGFVLGLGHALNADHVAAVSTIAGQTKSLKKSSSFGAIWGMGHTAALFLIGSVILIFRLAIPDNIALSFELLAGFVLVILGMDVLRKIIRDDVHVHRHEHHDVTHKHFHRHKESPSHDHRHKSFLVGMVHGLAGSAALMLLVLMTVNSTLQGFLFILIFGVGSTLGMLVTGAVIGLPFKFTARSGRINGSVKTAAGIISVVLGFAIIYEIGFVNGLFFQY